MAFDPTLPAANTPASSSEMRGQLTSLHEEALKPKGTYNAGTTYEINDGVIGDDDGYYRSLVDDNVGNTPSTSPSEWEVIAEPSTVEVIGGSATIYSDLVSHTTTALTPDTLSTWILPGGTLGNDGDAIDLIVCGTHNGAKYGAFTISMDATELASITTGSDLGTTNIDWDVHVTVTRKDSTHGILTARYHRWKPFDVDVHKCTYNFDAIWANDQYINSYGNVSGTERSLTQYMLQVRFIPTAEGS